MNSYSPIVDFLNTFTEHVAMQIAMALPKNATLFIHWRWLQWFPYRKFHLPEMKITIPSAEILNSRSDDFCITVVEIKTRD
jgi:anhydro-N-acetylmuramic acid kinase